MAIHRLLKNPLLLLYALLFCAGTAFGLDGAADIDVILEQLENNRRLVVEENMNLEADQQEAFWNVYAQYRQEMTALQTGRFKMLQEFRASFDVLSSKRAQEMLSAYLDTEARTVAVRQAYIAKFNAVLAAKQTLRFYQIDVKVDSIIQSEMSSTNPLIPG